MHKAIVRAFAKELPKRKVTNDQLSKLMETSDEWIVQRTGIKSRYWVDSPVTTSDLATAACEQSLEILGSNDVDAIIAATLSPDFTFPGIGVQIQSKLKLKSVPAFDIRNQCSGFLYGLEMAQSFVAVGKYRRVLVVGAEVQSTGIDISTRGRDVAVLFGDGAGSCIVERQDLAPKGMPGGFEILSTELHSDGDHLQELWCQNPASSNFPIRVSKEMLEDGSIFPKMNGKAVFQHAVRRMAEVSVSCLKKANLQVSDIDLFVPHQANLRINTMVGEQLGLDPKKVFNTIEKYANTTAATIPIGMTEAVAAERMKSGNVVLLAAFGSGFTWGAAVLRAV